MTDTTDTDDYDLDEAELIKRERREEAKARQTEAINLFADGNITLAVAAEMAAADGRTFGRVSVSKMLKSLPDSDPDDVLFALRNAGLTNRTPLTEISPESANAVMDRLAEAKSGAREALSRFPFWDSDDPRADDAATYLAEHPPDF